MPIKKRRNIPPPRKVPQPPDDPFKIPGKPLEHLVKEFDRKASDADWSGDYKEGARLQSIANGYRERLANGELYEIDH